MLMLTLFTPACRSSFPIRGSRRPLVVTHTSPMPSTWAHWRQMERMFLFTRGSPPVMRSLVIPREAAASTAASISSWVSISSWSWRDTPSSGMQ